MSDAHLSARQLAEGAPPVELTDEPIELGDREPTDGTEQRDVRSRRRRLAVVLLAVVALVGVGALGTWGWRIVQQKDARITTPDQIAGLRLDTSDRGGQHGRLPA
ncbi:hypothetical protein Van01_22500 [Micromonospora andamanensis]|uniref:Uncharacterized protein n=1 Tax=Micromonospora andamanensis TaxID=1287068 RepID=A0ABQ4HU63_9ACTN|nr:hypothetical protein Van01_22500 [Micromonospora andamanensis]